MSELTATQIPKPSDEQAFERCNEVLWRCILKDDRAHCYGRRGQRQHGVDIVGYRNGSVDRIVGIQCKLKGAGKVLEENEVRKEVTKALTFRPPLSEYIIVTTAPDDAKLVTLAIELSGSASVGREKNLKVSILGWGSLEREINRYPEARIPLKDHIETILQNLGRSGNDGISWVIDCEYDFSELSPKSKIVTKQMKEALAPLLRPYDDSVICSMHSRHLDKSKHAGEISLLRYPHICLDCGICLELAEFSHVPERFFLQNASDGKGIGIAEEMKKSIQNRISEKSKKIRNQRRIEEYENWWLLLVDHVCHLPMESLSDHELSCIRDQDFAFWTRVVIVSSVTRTVNVNSPTFNLHWHYDLFSAEPDHGSSSHPR